MSITFCISGLTGLALVVLGAPGCGGVPDGGVLRVGMGGLAFWGGIERGVPTALLVAGLVSLIAGREPSPADIFAAVAKS